MTFLEVLQQAEQKKLEATQKIQDNDTPADEVIESIKRDYEKFNTTAWSKGSGYKLPNFPGIEERLEGLDEGLYLLAAESNMGKSAVMLELLKDACMCEENNLFGIYYSLDDSKSDIIPRVISSMKMIPISVAAKPKRYQNFIDEGVEGSSIYEEMLQKREEGLEELMNTASNFMIEDSERIKTAEDMLAHMKKMQIYIKAINPNANIIVAIDAVDDIKFANKYFGNTTDRHAEIAKTIKDWSTSLHIVIFGARHLSKLKQNRRPVLDDLKDSNEYVYEASVVWLLYNDVSKNKQAAKIYNTVEETSGKQPIIELDWAKNKKSSYKGRTYNYFTPEYSSVSECSKEVSKRFDALIYSN
jgi:replicative DNA helicase